MFRNNRWWIISGAVVLLLLAVIQLWQPPAVYAQCGAQSSSCKSCHEVQGQDPVNNNGAWHTDHAFGDFCEYCHSGNVQATDKTAAHEGLVTWNADVKASCATCHATDYEQRAEVYASTLGVDLNTGGGASSASTGAVDDATTACAPQGGEEIDFNLLYAEQIAPPPLVSNWGNVILGLMILGVVIVFFGTAWTWEGWGPSVAGWIRTNVTPVTEAVAAVSAHADDAGSSAADPAKNGEDPTDSHPHEEIHHEIH